MTPSKPRAPASTLGGREGKEVDLREWNRCVETGGQEVKWRSWSVQEVFIHSCPKDARLLCPACAGIGATVGKKEDLSPALLDLAVL